MFLTFSLELDLLTARLLTLQLNLIHIWHPRRGNHCLILLFTGRLVGSLVYLTVTRPDISYAVHQVSQYLSAPRSTHYAAVLCILWYLKGILFHGLFYSVQSPFVLRAFSNADWAGDPTDRRSTTGYCFLLGFSLISCEVRNKPLWPTPVLKQNIVPLLIPHLSSFGYNGFLRI